MSTLPPSLVRPRIYSTKPVLEAENVLSLTILDRPAKNGLEDVFENATWEQKILDFEKFLRKKEKRAMGMNYLPKSVQWKKELRDFPSNKEFGLDNHAIIRSRLTGDDEMLIADLNAMEKPDPENPLKSIPMYSSGDILIRIMAALTVSWTFVDEETSTPCPISPENIRSLLREDFDYLATEFGTVLQAMNPEKVTTPTLDPTAPAQSLTEDEKKLSPSDSTTESVTSVPVEIPAPTSL